MLVQLVAYWKLYHMSKRLLMASESYETLSTNYSIVSSDSFYKMGRSIMMGASIFAGLTPLFFLVLC